MQDQPHHTPLHQPWLAPEELTGPTPRRFKWHSGGKGNFILCLIILVIGFAIVTAIWETAREDHALAEDAQTADSVITRKWTDHGSRSTYYRVAYEFSVDGKKVKGESGLSQRKWNGLSTGSHTPVLYVPAEPNLNRPSLAYDTVLSYWVPAGATAFWIFSLVVAWSPIRKEKRLLQYGLVVPGTITNNQSGSRPKYGWVIKYEYQLSDGTVLKGRTQRDRTYRQGQVVTILYDPKRPKRSEIYPTKLGLIES
jgi:hypothetical protein